MHAVHRQPWTAPTRALAARLVANRSTWAGAPIEQVVYCTAVRLSSGNGCRTRRVAGVPSVVCLLPTALHCSVPDRTCMDR